MKRALSSIAQIGAVFAISLVLVLKQGLSVCDPFFLLPFGTFSAVLAGPIAIESIGRDSPGGLWGLLIRAVAKACGILAMILALSLAMANWLLWRGAVALPHGDALAGAILVSVAAAAAAASVVAALRQRLPAQTVRWGFRIFLMAALLAYQFLPPDSLLVWYGLAADHGLIAVALSWTAGFLAIGVAAYLFLRRPVSAIT